MAIAPPLTFVFSGSRPSSRMTGIACAANASLSSMRSRSSTARPARSSARWEAGIGPRPIVAGSTPATADATILAIGRRPSSRALASDVTSTAAAPSLMPDEFPAVTEPVPSRLNAGFSDPSDSRVASGRGCSSVSKGPRGVSMDTISSAKRPAAFASAQRCWEARANDPAPRG